MNSLFASSSQQLVGFGRPRHVSRNHHGLRPGTDGHRAVTRTNGPRSDVRMSAAGGEPGPGEETPLAAWLRAQQSKNASSSSGMSSLDERIESGEFSDVGSTKEKLTRPLRKLLAKDPIGAGRLLSLQLAKLGRFWRAEAAKRMPTATGDMREIVGQPVFVPLYKLFLVYGKIFRLNFGPKSFVIISDPAYAKQILLTNAEKYSKGLLSEILDFVMGKGLIPADGEIWKMRRRAIVPALHKKYVASMVNMFGDCTLHGAEMLEQSHREKGDQGIDMENFFSRLALDIIGKAVFNYEFDSLTHDDPVIQAVYTVLREAEHRSTAPIAYWNLPGATSLVPRQRRCVEALQVVNNTLNELIAKCKKLVEDEEDEFVEEFLSEADPSILHFLLASGDEISSKQLRDDLMTLLIAGHETTAAVLTWTFYLLAQHPNVAEKLRQEVDTVIGDRKVTVEDMRALKYTTRVINEAMRLYPQPPVLIRRALESDTFDNIVVEKGSDIFISVWNIHRSPAVWSNPAEFKPERFPLDGPIPNEVTENFAYLPFGGGRRKCIGDQFALFESIVALAMLVRRFDFQMAPNAPPVGMETGATIHTINGLYMTATPRQLSKSTVPVGAATGIAASGNGNGYHSNGNGNGYASNGNGYNGNGSSNGYSSNGNGSSTHSSVPSATASHSNGHSTPEGSAVSKKTESQATAAAKQ